MGAKVWQTRHHPFGCGGTPRWGRSIPGFGLLPPISRPGRDSPLRLGSTVPTSLVPLDIAFTSVRVGDELVKEGSVTFVAKTTDGGSSWHVTSPAMASSTQAASPSGPHFPGTATTPALAVSPNRTVIAYGISASVVEESADDGLSWQSSQLPGSVEDVLSSGSTFTALIDGPQLATGPHGQLPPPPLLGWVYASNSAGRSWRRVGMLPADFGPYKALVEPTATGRSMRSRPARTTLTTAYMADSCGASTRGRAGDR